MPSLTRAEREKTRVEEKLMGLIEKGKNDTKEFFRLANMLKFWNHEVEKETKNEDENNNDNVTRALPEIPSRNEIQNGPVHRVSNEPDLELLTEKQQEEKALEASNQVSRAILAAKNENDISNVAERATYNAVSKILANSMKVRSVKSKKERQTLKKKGYPGFIVGIKGTNNTRTIVDIESYNPNDHKKYKRYSKITVKAKKNNNEGNGNQASSSNE
jgi:hypothetical protein